MFTDNLRGFREEVCAGLNQYLKGSYRIIRKNRSAEANVIKIIVFMTKKKAHLPNTKQTGGLFSMLS